MKKWIIAALASLLAANLALADGPRCDTAVRDKNVPLKTRELLAKSCEKANAFLSCEKSADDRNLIGNARKSFMQKCAGLAPTGKK